MFALLTIVALSTEIKLLITKEKCEVSVNVFVDSSVGDLKKKLQEKTGLHPLQQQLILNKQTLLDHQKISDLNIHDGCKDIKLTEIIGKIII